MGTVALTRSARTRTIRLTTTHPTEFVDITDRLLRFVEESGVGIGILTLQTLHTTTAVVLNEHEPLLLADFERLLDRTAPRTEPYWHDEMALRPDVAGDEPVNGHAHCRALMLPSSLSLTVIGGMLMLGRWQRVFFVELDGPRERELSAVLLGDTGPDACGR